eukprot:12060163-Karenia_brevis.AAC.1
MPDKSWAYNLKQGAKLSEEQRKLMHQWDPGLHSGAKMQEFLLQLDRALWRFSLLMVLTISQPWQ